MFRDEIEAMLITLWVAHRYNISYSRFFYPCDSQK